MKTLSIPFALDGYGRIRSTTANEKVYADRVRFALMTIPGERIMRPEFGSSIAEQSFEDPEDAAEEIKVAARQAFSEFLPDLTLDQVLISWEDLESGTVAIEVTYSSNITLSTYSSTVALNV